MKLVIPMAGRGSRLRPHTLTVPKPLIPIAGKPIVQRLAEDIARLLDEPIEEIAFIIGDFGKEVEKDLLKIADKLGAKGTVVQQHNPQGTAHAIWMAEQSLSGPVVVAFADTLFKANFQLDTKNDGLIWVKKVEDPSAFGVVKLDEQKVITEFIEKPKEFVSDLAIIGIYFFKDGENLREEIKYLIDNDIRGNGGEFQLTDVLENMKKKGKKFGTAQVDDWMDCGNKDVTVETNNKVLGYEQEHLKIPESAKIINSQIIPPCYIGENVVIENSIIGPYASVGNKTKISFSNIRYSLIQKDSKISDANLSNSMIGNHAQYTGVSRDVSLGDYTVLDF